MGEVASKMVNVVCSLKQDPRVTVEFRTEVPYASSRNNAVKRVLGEGFDYWLSIDEDNPPTKNPLDLIKAKKDIIGLPTPVFKDGFFAWNIAKSFPDGDRFYLLNNETANSKRGLVKEDIVSSGCMLISKKALEVIEQPFLRRFDKDGIVTRGTDFSFCDKAREKGIDIWCAWDYKCNHFKRINLLDVWQSQVAT